MQKSEKRKLKRLRKPKLRKPRAPPSKRFASKRDYKRTKKVDVDG